MSVVIEQAHYSVLGAASICAEQKPLTGGCRLHPLLDTSRSEHGTNSGHVLIAELMLGVQVPWVYGFSAAEDPELGCIYEDATPLEIAPMFVSSTLLRVQGTC